MGRRRRLPFDATVRDYHFEENKALWKPGKPKLRGIRLLEALATAKGMNIGTNRPEVKP